MDLKDQILKNGYAAYTLVANTFLSRIPIGTNIYQRDWDLLIILDACRVDAMNEIANEFDFISEVDTILSVGSTSKEWIERTFIDQYKEEVNNTAYVTANPFADNLIQDGQITHRWLEFKDTFVERYPALARSIQDDVCRESEFGLIDGLWGSAERDSEFMSIQHPDNVTDHSISVGRYYDFDRQIVHYMQPHTPYFSSANDYNSLKPYEKHPFRFLKDGRVDKSEIFDLYLQNLRYVLKSVRILLENIDAGKVIITADHGELFGEMRMYSHHACHPHPALRKVPWVETTARDNQTAEPNITRNDIKRMYEVSKEELSALGYI